MDCNSTYLSYQQTGFFSPLLIDYLNNEPALQPLFEHKTDAAGIEAVIANRRRNSPDRELLVGVLRDQYRGISLTPVQQQNLDALAKADCFTICTAHQPNIFTGHLYFIYKILHAIKLAEHCKQLVPSAHFVPVYYMGSEDADLEELGHIYIEGEKYEWNTQQQGAVGRMKVDKALIQLLADISGRLLVYPFGGEITGLLTSAYKEGITIEQATLTLVNSLFANYGLLVLLPDNAKLKQSFIPVIERELTQSFSHPLVAETLEQFPKKYKTQASGRETNLFYIIEDKRERLEKTGEEWTVLNTPIKFSQAEIINELHLHPERFSPNVILRPIFQEWILPNIAFIGGGGELAYWLELKKVFQAVNVPYPLLVVRNSFLLLDKRHIKLAKTLELDLPQLFKPELELHNELVKRDSKLQLSLANEKKQLVDLYHQVQVVAGKIDITLQQHTSAMQIQALKKVEALEKKMLRAEKRKFADTQRQLHLLKNQLFPNNSLQERVENFSLFYAKSGKAFIEMIYNNSPALEQQFVILAEK